MSVEALDAYSFTTNSLAPVHAQWRAGHLTGDIRGAGLTAYLIVYSPCCSHPIISFPTRCMDCGDKFPDVEVNSSFTAPELLPSSRPALRAWALATCEALLSPLEAELVGESLTDGLYAYAEATCE